MAGGYLGGGGHSYLSGIYGFAADNVLEWEIVTADGVVLSATVRVFPNEVTSNAAFSFSVSQAGGVEQYWNAVSAYHQQLKPLLDQGMVADYGFTNGTMVVNGVMAPGQTNDSLHRPWLFLRRDSAQRPEFRTQSYRPAYCANAAQPNFNDAYSSLMISPRWSNSLPWWEAQVLQDQLVNELLPIYDAAAQDAGAYKIEANWADKDIKKSFYAGTYERLGYIKKIDPEGFFYGITSVGFDRFAWDSAGRLCNA
ncbi:MAG: hypothetical protein Q9179_000875 [Wetmoreana sp. 5 TL-2023]